MGERSRSPRRVAVLIEASNAYARGLLAGIHAHLREHEPWTVFLPEHGRGKPPLEALARWHGDGIIARIETPAIARTVADLRATQGVHVVDVSAARLVPGVPYVETADAAIATVAAEHFFERDFRQVAFLGDRRFQWSDNRRDAFTTAAAARGMVADVFRHGRGYDDDPALDACRRVGIAVPDEAAILGVDDDELVCGLASPSLSSVIPDAAGAGRLSAALLERLMRGEALDCEEWLLPPVGISTRQSTDVLAIDDELVVAAVRHVRDQASRGLRVAGLVRALGTTRRVLESRFTKRVGHTPHEEILRVQFRRIEQLLRETDLPLSEIAARSGFRHAEYMTVAFARRHGMPPSVWRKRHRLLGLRE